MVWLRQINLVKGLKNVLFWPNDANICVENVTSQNKESGPFWLQDDTSGDYKKALLTVVE